MASKNKKSSVIAPETPKGKIISPIEYLAIKKKAANKKEVATKQKDNKKEENKEQYDDTDYRSKLNDNIAYKRAVSKKNRIEYIVDEIITATVAYKRDRHNDDLMRISSVALGVEQDEDSWIDSLRFFIPMKQFGCFEDFYPDRHDYVFKKPNLEKLKEYRAKIKQEIGINDLNPIAEQSNRSIEFRRQGNRGTLTIDGFRPLPFQDFRCKLIDLFYMATDRNHWWTYDEIKVSIGHEVDAIRKSVEKINERVKNHTQNEQGIRQYDEIIAVDPPDDPDNTKIPKRFRWKW